MELNSEIFKNLSHHLQKLNLYILPRYIWLVLLYYLSVNAVLNYLLIYVEKDSSLLNLIPVEAFKINNLILTGLDKWIPFIWFLSFALFISGFVITFLKLVNMNLRDVEYGLHISFWLFIIGATFEIFNILGMFFITLIPITAFVKHCIAKLMDKLDISFD